MSETATPDLIDIVDINPSHSDKYSPNLYKWLKVRGHSYRLRYNVFRDGDGALWIGEFDTDGTGGRWFTGRRLMRVLCIGVKAEEFAYMKMPDIEIIPDFWQQYVALGRCVIDPEHRGWWRNDEMRWTVDGDTRSCNWCGNCVQELHRCTEEVERITWRTVEVSR